MTRLKDGQTRKIRPAFKGMNSQFEVIAERVDADTPYIHIFPKGQANASLVLTDTDAHDLIQRLKKALSILPTSK